MPKVRTLARKFLKGHPREGQDTLFVEKVLNSIGIDYYLDYLDRLLEINGEKIKTGKISKDQIVRFFESTIWTIEKKRHTIRAGKHFKTGDQIQLAVWTGKPYFSPLINICPPLTVKCWDFQISKNPFPTGPKIYHGIDGTHHELDEIAAKDGLSLDDFKAWFKYPQPFDGQIISWDSKLEY